MVMMSYYKNKNILKVFLKIIAKCVVALKEWGG